MLEFYVKILLLSTPSLHFTFQDTVACATDPVNAMLELVLTRIRLTTGKIVDEVLGDLDGRMDGNRPADKRTFNEERQADVTRSALLTADVRRFFYDLMGIFVELELPVVRHSLSSWTDNIKLKTRKSSCVNARGIPSAV